MEEQKTIERPLMSEEEFKDYMEKNRVDIVGDFYEKDILHLRTFEAVSRYKSIRRAIRRGHVSLDGYVYPKRPFNNAKHLYIDSTKLNPKEVFQVAKDQLESLNIF